MNCGSFHYVQFGHPFVWSKESLLVRTLRLYMHQVAPRAAAYLSFSSTERLGVFLVPPRWDVSPSQGYRITVVSPTSRFAYCTMTIIDSPSWYMCDVGVSRFDLYNNCRSCCFFQNPETHSNKRRFLASLRYPRVKRYLKHYFSPPLV